MAFTSWADLEQKMKDAIADNTWSRQVLQIDGRSTTYRSLPEFLTALDAVSARAAAEAGNLAARTYAQCGGRGYVGGCR